MLWPAFPCSHSPSCLHFGWLQTSAQHACVTKRDGDHFVEDLGSEAGTWLNDRRLQAKVPKLLRPGPCMLLLHN